MPAKSTVAVVHISSSISGGSCRVCGQGLAVGNGYESHFERNVNHYLGHPNCALLHVGQETDNDDGTPQQTTVAVISIASTR